MEQEQKDYAYEEFTRLAETGLAQNSFDCLSQIEVH